MNLRGKLSRKWTKKRVRNYLGEKPGTKLFKERLRRKEKEKKTKLAFLNENLIFKRAKDVRDPLLSKISFGHGSCIAKQLSSFLRHGMKEGQYCKVDGSIRYL